MVKTQLAEYINASKEHYLFKLCLVQINSIFEPFMCLDPLLFFFVFVFVTALVGKFKVTYGVKMEACPNIISVKQKNTIKPV